MSQSTSGAGGLARGRFFLPGPTEVYPEVLEAQTRPMISHRGAAMTELLQELQKGLEVVFVTKRPVFIGTCSATGFMETAVRNGASKKVLSLINGAFSKRFAEIARSCGLQVDDYEVPWGEAHDPQQVSERLAKGGYHAVTMVHSETSTGVLNDIRALSAAIRKHGDVMVLVDSVSSFAGAEIRTDEWGLDFLLTGSQKAFALPPGLAFGVASERMMARAATVPNRGYYFDLLKFAESFEKWQTHITPGLSTMFALQVQVKRMLAESMEGRWARHMAMAKRTWAWVDEMKGKGVNLEVLAPEGYRSPCVTTIKTPDPEGGPAIVKAMAAKGWVIGGGYGKMKPSSIRIGHMGDHSLEELNELLGVLGEVVK
ncbi:MAG: alanine--glyoxylate aminotransferase family protein [Gemmatimonadota bacterium]